MVEFPSPKRSTLRALLLALLHNEDEMSELSDRSHGPRKKVLRSIRVPADYAQAADEWARLNGESWSGLVRRLLAQGWMVELGADPRDFRRRVVAP